MEKDNNKVIEKKLDSMIDLLQQLLAFELLRGGVGMADIGKHLHIATATVVKMLKGVKKEK